MRRRSGIARATDAIVVALLLAVGALLLGAHLDDTYLWQDEAETALLARSVLVHGIPVAFDGRNLVSQERQQEFSPDDHVWAWTPWLQHYAAAASFALFGASTWSARAPFVLFGLACLFVTQLLGRQVGRDPVTGPLALLLTTVSVPFLLHMRQCRYYAPLSFFAVLLMHEYLRVLRGGRYARLGMIAAATGLFHSHYVVASALLGATVAHFSLRWLRGRAQAGELQRVAAAWGATILLALPFVVFFARHTRGQALPGLARSLGALREAAYHFNLYIFPFALVLLAGALFWARRRAAEPRTAAAAGTPSPLDGGVLLGLATLITVGVLCSLMPWFFFRYYVALIPLCAVLQAMLIVELARWRVVPAAFLMVLLLTTDLVSLAVPITHRVPANSVRHLRTGDETSAEVVGEWARHIPLAAYLYEIDNEFHGPIEALSRYLRENAEPSDTLIATYGDLPLQFYTPLQVVGGLSGVDITPHADAEWILVRAHTHRAADRRLKHLLARTIDFSQYEAIALPVLDTPYENRPDPTYHKYRTVERGLPWVQIWRRKDTLVDSRELP